MSWVKKISLFLTSQAISIFGSTLVHFCIIWYITLETRSGVYMMLATLCGFVPQILVSLFAGVWADRYNKKHLIIAADSLIAISTTIVATLYLLGMEHIWLLFIVLAVRSFGGGIQAPTVNSLIPEIVPKENYMRVNGVNTSIQSIVMIVSPVAAGFLLRTVGLGLILFVDVITAIIGISILSFVKYIHKQKETKNAFAQIKEGIVYTKNNKLISRLIFYSTVFGFLITPLAILTPLLVTRTFGDTALYLTANEITFFVGSVLGGALISIWGGFKSKVKTMVLGCILCGIASMLMGFSTNFIFYLTFMGLVGVTMAITNTPALTIMQENIEESMYGRVFSLLQLITGSVMPLSMILYGPLADVIKIQYIIIACGILFTIISFIVLKDKVMNTVDMEELKANA